ncbi:putative isochorismatase family protein YddQ [Meyerozyma sp. JA9]|nr:putative isochorismatase family protein YddQ [Meyerozyma sp. JA9]
MPKTAFVLIDIQNDYFEGGLYPLVDINRAADNSAKLLQQLRKLPDQFHIIHVRHEFTGEAKDAPFFGKDTPGSQIHEKVKNNSDEPVILKHCPNSFIETSLKSELDNNGIKDVVIVGAMAHMCVQGTTRGAAELGYNATVITDAVAAPDLEYGGVTVPAKQVSAAVFATLAFGYAKLTTTEEFLGALD